MSYNDLAGLVRFAPRMPKPPRGRRQSSPFSAPFKQTVTLLVRELRALGARDVVMEVDIPQSRIRQDGMPRSDARAMSPGITLHFTAAAVKGRPRLEYDVDSYVTWQDNVRALALALEALRKVTRYRVLEEGSQYVGQRALPAGSGESSMNVAEATEFFQSEGVSTTAEGAAALTKRFHPDRNGGDRAMWDKLQAAKGALSL